MRSARHVPAGRLRQELASSRFPHPSARDHRAPSDSLRVRAVVTQRSPRERIGAEPRTKFSDLGEIHFGRKRVQPPRREIREFYRKAELRLDLPTLWLDDAKRQAISDAFARVVESDRYTVWGCAILKNHAHLLVRRHRDDARTMWARFAESSRDALRRLADASDDHPVWANHPYAVFLYHPDDVRRVEAYIAQNPVKEGLPSQSWPFVKPYDG